MAKKDQTKEEKPVDTGTENQEQQQPHMTFGVYLTQPISYAEGRKDEAQVRVLFSAILDMLHIAIGANENHVSKMLINNAINQVILAQSITDKALAYSDEVGFDLEPKQ